MSRIGFEDDHSLADLRDCPVQITLHTDSQIEMIKKTARADPDSIPPIDVAELDQNTIIIVDGHARVRALRSVGIDKIRAKRHTVKNMTDAVVLHVRLNQKSQLNPIRFYDVFEFLKENGYDSNEIPRQLWLTESYSRLLKIALAEKARTLLERYLDELVSKYSLVHLPVHVVEAIGKIKEEHQVEAVNMMIQMMPQNISEFKFSFPSFDQLEIAFSSFRKEDGKQREPIIFTLKDNEAESSKSSATLASDEEFLQDEPKARMVPSKEEVDRAKEIINNVPHRALITCPHGTKYLVDMKNHTISEVKEDDRVISIRGDSSEPVFMIPSEYAKFLQLDYGDPVYFKSLGTHEQLEKFVDGTKGRDLQIVVMSSQKI